MALKQRYSIDLPADQASEDLIRNLLAGLAAKFDNEQSHVDAESSRQTESPSFQELGRGRRRSPTVDRGVSPAFLKCRNAK